MYNVARKLVDIPLELWFSSSTTLSGMNFNSSTVSNTFLYFNEKNQVQPLTASLIFKRGNEHQLTSATLVTSLNYAPISNDMEVFVEQHQ